MGKDQNITQAQSSTQDIQNDKQRGEYLNAEWQKEIKGTKTLSEWLKKAEDFYKEKGINPDTIKPEVDKGNSAGLLFKRAKEEGVEIED